MWLVPTSSGPPAQRYSFLLGKTRSLHCAVWVGTFFVILRYMLYPRNTRDCGCVQKLSRNRLAMFPRAPIGGFRSRHPILSRPQTDAIVSWPYMHLKANGMICWSWTRVHGSAELWPADIDLESHPSQYLPRTIVYPVLCRSEVLLCVLSLSYIFRCKRLSLVLYGRRKIPNLASLLGYATSHSDHMVVS